MRLSRRPRRRAPAPGTAPNPEPGIAFGWRAHDAIQGWTASVDTKASVVLVVETAVAGAGATGLITQTGQLHSAVGLHLACAVTAVVFLILAVAASLWVVFPRLEHSRTRRVASTGLIYFGHLRERSSTDIEAALAGLTPEEERRQLASQLTITADVAWRKHRWLQCSLSSFALGAILLVLAYTAF